jgi:hypothetical protein
VQYKIARSKGDLCANLGYEISIYVTLEFKLPSVLECLSLPVEARDEDDMSATPVTRLKARTLGVNNMPYNDDAWSSVHSPL